MSESNCVTHNAPYRRGSWCEVYADAYEAGRDESGVFVPSEDFGECEWAPDRWPEPHEGIVGTQRVDDLLDLEERALARRSVIVTIAKALHDALLVGNPAPRVKRMYDRFGNHAFDSDPAKGPQIGDLVVESTAFYDTAAQRTGFGILLASRTEWGCTLAEWNETIDEERRWHDESDYPDKGEFDPDAELGPRRTDHAVYVQYGPNPEAVCRWYNCSFVALPTTQESLDKLRPEFGTRDGRSVTVDRNDLVSALADSGIELRVPRD